MLTGRRRLALVAAIALATIGFVIGTSAERTRAHRETPAAHRVQAPAPAAETGAEIADEGAAAGAPAPTEVARERHPELKPLGVNVEAVPFVILAVLGSLALAATAWLRPRAVAVLVAVAVAMLVFAALDVREVFHQHAEARSGLAVLAGAIAALHLVAAAIAGGSVRTRSL